MVVLQDAESCHFWLASGFHLAFLNLECHGQFSLYILHVPTLEAFLILSVVIGTVIQIASAPRAGPEHYHHASLLRVPDIRANRRCCISIVER